MKLLFCDNSLKELLNFRGDVIKHFLDKQNIITIVAPNNLINNDFNESIKVYSPGLERSGMNPFKEFQYMWRLMRIYRREKPDLIFHYTIKPNVYGSIAAKICGIPSVAMVTGLGYAFFHSGIKTRIARYLYRIALKFPKRILVLNESNMETLLEMNMVNKERVVLLAGGEGINLNLFK